jgi:membrane protein
MKRDQKSQKGLDWKRLILGQPGLYWAAVKKFNQDNGFFLASAITFDLLICLIPSILLLLGLIGNYLYEDRAVLDQIRRYLDTAVPSLDPQIMDNLWKVIRDRQIVGILGFGGLLWASTWIFGSLRTALNIIFQAKGRGVFWGKGIDVLMVFAGGILFLVSLFLTSGITFLQQSRLTPWIGLGPIAQWALKYVVPFVFTFFMFILIYRIIPNRGVRLRSVLHGALFSSVLWDIVKHLFEWYVLHLGRFSALYGSLSTLAVFFFWIYYSSCVLLLGGEVVYIKHTHLAGEPDANDAVKGVNQLK